MTSAGVVAGVWRIVRLHRWLWWLAASFTIVPLPLLAATGETTPLATSVAVWLDAAGRPSAGASRAIDLLMSAADDGLVPADYRAVVLGGEARTLGSMAVPDTARAHAFAAALDAAMQRYLHDLHLGRVDPRALDFRVARRTREPTDFAALARSAAQAGRLPQVVAELRPTLPQYEQLRAALARYRALQRDDTIPFSAMRSAAGGAPRLDRAALRRRLVLLGDLPRAALDANAGEAELVEALERFQRRHGLAVDGVAGPVTLRALAVPVATRVRQLELALERLRWLPDPSREAFIGINIAMFRLWAWDPSPRNQAPLDMAVVVGRALDTHTPVLTERMRYVVFRPYWNVPSSIVQKEILPALARDPGTLQRQDLEIVKGGGDDARPVPVTPENIALLRAGSLRLRQRPGPRNSLGLVKFIFPNDADVYLHGTPAQQLFDRARRDFSHGCVRVEDPVALAHWVLRDQPAWTVERIEAAMNSDAPQRVDLPRPLPVILFYITAMANPADGTLQFAEDIYGHDARLERALAARAGR